MSHRVQITLEDNLWEFLQKIPKNARSQILKKAVADELTRQHRRQIANQMDELREQLKPLPGNSEEWLREERDGRP